MMEMMKAGIYQENEDYLDLQDLSRNYKKLKEQGCYNQKLHDEIQAYFTYQEEKDMSNIRFSIFLTEKNVFEEE